MEEETKVTIQIPVSTLQMIEKAKEKLSQHKLFTWMKHLSTEEFLAFYFGWTEVSQFCRETLHKIFSEVNSEAPPPPQPSEKRHETKMEPLVEVTSIQKQVVDALAEAKMPLTMRQIAEKTGLKLKQVDYALDALKAKGVITRIPESHEWQLAIEPEKVAVKEIGKDKLLNYIKTIQKPFTAQEIASKLNMAPQCARTYLYELEKKGVVERIAMGKWKTKQI